MADAANLIPVKEVQQYIKTSSLLTLLIAYNWQVLETSICD